MQRRKPYKAKGAVLIMVLTVMFVLIFLLAGAVAVVYSSNRRVMVQYEESQAYYTARSVLDVYHDMILASDDTSKVSGHYYELDKTTYEVTSSTTYSNISSGRALELDLYRVPVSVNATIGEANFNKTFADEYNSVPAGTANDPARAAVVRSRNMTEDIADATSAPKVADYLKQYTVTGSDSSKYSVDDADANQIASVTDWSGASPKYAVGKDDTLVYYVNYDKTKNESNFSKYQGTPTGSNSAANKLTDPGSTVKLTVQVIDRVYDLSTDAAYTTFRDKFIHGNREKDYFLIKVTAEVVYDGQIVTTSAVYQNKKRDYPKLPSTKAIVAMSGAHGSGDTFMALGGGSMLSLDAGIEAKNNMNLEGNFSIQSSYDIKDKEQFLFIDGASTFFVREDLVASNQKLTSDSTPVVTGATLFAGRSIVNGNGSGNGLIGDVSNRKKIMNIVTPLFKAKNMSKVFGRGVFETLDMSEAVQNDVFYAEDGTTGFGGKYFCNYLVVPSDAITISGTDITISDKTYGRIQQKASVTVTMGIVTDDGSSTLDFDGNNGNGYTVYKFSDGYNIVSAGPNATDQRIVANSTAGEIKLDYDTDFSSYDAAYKRVFDLPAAIPLVQADADGSNASLNKKKIEADTVRSLYDEYFVSTGRTDGADTWTATGDLNYSSPSDYEAFIADHVKLVSGVDGYYPTINANTATTKVIDFTGVNNNFTSAFSKVSSMPAGSLPSNIRPEHSNWYYIPSGSEVVIPEANSDSTGFDQGFVIDATNDSVTIQFGNPTDNSGTGNVFGGRYAVYGDNDVTVLIPSNSPNTEINLGSYSGSVKFSFYKTETVMSDDPNNGDYTNGRPSRINLDGTNKTPAPSNIVWYVSDNVSTIRTYQGTDTVQGDIKAPTSKVQLNNQHATYVPTYKTPYGSTSCMHNSFMCTYIGSLLCNEFEVVGDAKVGVVYIPSDPPSSGATPGKPLYTWPAQYYTMN